MQDFYNAVGVILFLAGVPLVLLMIMFRIIMWWQDGGGKQKWSAKAKRILFGKRWEQW